MQRRRVLAIASGGGHWVQLRRLDLAFSDVDVAYASVYPEYSGQVGGHRFYAFPDVSRLNPVRLLPLVASLLSILVRERPGVIVTTGSLPGLIAIALGKTLFGARTIWIDSIANCETLSTSGNHARRFADIYLTQWPQLATREGPHYWGAVL